MFLIGCNKTDRAAENHIKNAESVMDTHPDSALREMERIDTCGLSEGMMARYCLQMTKAMDKNYIFPKSDSLILRAVEYYKGENDSNEIQSLYYYGNALFNINRESEAISVLNIANDMAVIHNDWFYIGMCKRFLAHLYKNESLFKEQLKSAVESKKAFRKFEHERGDTTNRYSAWMDMEIMESYINNNRLWEAMGVFNHADSSRMSKDAHYRNVMYINKAQIHKKRGEHSKAIEIYRQLIADGMDMKPYNWNRLAESYAAVSHYDAAKSVLDSSKSAPNLDQVDSLYISYIETKILSETGNAGKTLEAYRKYTDLLTASTNKSLSGSPVPYITQAYKAQMETEQLKKKIHMNVIALMAILIFLLGVILSAIWIILRYRLKAIRVENERNRTEAEALAYKNSEARIREVALLMREEELLQRISSLNTEKDILVHEIKETKAVKSLKDSNNNRLLKSIKKRFANIDATCQMWYKTPSAIIENRDMPPAAEKQLQLLRTPVSLEEYDLLIDFYSQGWIEKINSECKNIPISKLRLARYLYMGISIESISFLMSKSKEQIYTDKSRLKSIILTNSDQTFACNALRKLGMKK